MHLLIDHTIPEIKVFPNNEWYQTTLQIDIVIYFSLVEHFLKLLIYLFFNLLGNLDLFLFFRLFTDLSLLNWLRLLHFHWKFRYRCIYCILIRIVVSCGIGRFIDLDIKIIQSIFLATSFYVTDIRVYCELATHILPIFFLTKRTL